jgi:hypothetical protein
VRIDVVQWQKFGYFLEENAASISRVSNKKILLCTQQDNVAPSYYAVTYDNNYAIFE